MHKEKFESLVISSVYTYVFVCMGAADIPNKKMHASNS